MQIVRNHVGNIYGLDIKLTEANGHIIPVGIEMNGVDFGTNFYGYKDGFNYYRAFARVLGAAAQGKPIFIQGYKNEQRDSLLDANERLRIQRKNEATQRYLKQRRFVLDDIFDFDASWSDDMHAFDLSKLEKEVDNEEETHYLTAAENEKVTMVVFVDIKYRNNNLEFLLTDGRKMIIKPQDIGIIRATFKQLPKVPPEYRHLFLNDPLIESILDSKPLFHYLGEFNSALRNLFAPSIPYGAGVNEASDVISFLNSMNSEMVVRKKGNSYCGVGVRIIPAGEIISELGPQLHKPVSLAMLDAMVDIMIVGVRKLRYENLTSMYEQFVPSIPIYDSRTDHFHDGCARTVVYTRNGQAPTVLGSQWRLAPASIDDLTAAPEQRFRANLSRGAREMPIDPIQEKIINDFAMQVVREFEKAICDYKNFIKDGMGYLNQEYPGITEAEAF